jgi:hypothetical protein
MGLSGLLIVPLKSNSVTHPKIMLYQVEARPLLALIRIEC